MSLFKTAKTLETKVASGYVMVKCCSCRVSFQARIADRKRGWGKHCSKSCKAKKQESRTGQYAAYKNRIDRSVDSMLDTRVNREDSIKLSNGTVVSGADADRILQFAEMRREERRQELHDYAMNSMGGGWDDHKDY